MEEKTPLSHEVVCFHMQDFGTSNSNYCEVSKSNSTIVVENFFLENCNSEGAVSHNVLIYYHQLSISDACQVSFYANNYFE